MKKEQGYSFIESIANNKKFRNPSIYEKLIEATGLKDSGTNFTKDVFDPDAFGEDCYYDKLREEQQNYMMELEKKAKRKEKKMNAQNAQQHQERRTKWDKGTF